LLTQIFTTWMPMLMANSKMWL